MSTLLNDPARGRFEMAVEGRTVFADYRLAPGRLVIDHVEAPPELRGRGAAGRLMEAITGHARAEGLSITPLCSYAARWLHLHAEHSDLVAPSR
jgi:hypothetical protein